MSWRTHRKIPHPEVSTFKFDLFSMLSRPSSLVLKYRHHMAVPRSFSYWQMNLIGACLITKKDWPLKTREKKCHRGDYLQGEGETCSSTLFSGLDENQLGFKSRKAFFFDAIELECEEKRWVNDLRKSLEWWWWLLSRRKRKEKEKRMSSLYHCIYLVSSSVIYRACTRV